MASTVRHFATSLIPPSKRPGRGVDLRDGSSSSPAATRSILLRELPQLAEGRETALFRTGPGSPSQADLSLGQIEVVGTDGVPLISLRPVSRGGGDQPGELSGWVPRPPKATTERNRSWSEGRHSGDQPRSQCASLSPLIPEAGAREARAGPSAYEYHLPRRKDGRPASGPLPTAVTIGPPTICLGLKKHPFSSRLSEKWMVFQGSGGNPPSVGRWACNRKTPGISRIPGVLVCSGGEARSPDLTIMSRVVDFYPSKRGESL